MFSSSPKSKLRKDFNLFVLTQKTPCNPLQNTTYQSAQALKLKKQETPESLIKQPNTAEISLFLELINEQKRLLHYKRLSKVYENIFSFISKDNRGFFLGFEIRMLRIFLLTILKRVKNSLVKKVTNFSKTMNLIHQCLSVFKNYYKFLTTYINTTKLHLNPKHVLDQSKNEYPSLSDISSNENESGNENLPPFIDIISGKHGSFNEFPNKINSRFESSCFIAKLLELLLLNGFFFKRTGNFTLAFKYLKKASTTALKLDFSFNPDILNLCAKAHLSLAVLFLDFGKVRKAEKLLNLGSILLQAELVYRMGLGGFQGSELKKNERLRVKRTVKTLVSCLVNMIFCFSTRKAIVKIAETTILLDNLMGVYLSQNDEFRKAVMKMIKEFRKKYLLGIEEISEIEEIIDGFLKHDYYFQKKLNPFYFPNERKDMNITSYKSPKIHNLIHPIIKKAPEPKKQRKQSISKRLSLDLRTLKNVEGIVNLDSITKRTASTLKKVDFPLELINKGPSDIKRTDRPQPFTNSKDLTMETFLLADFFDNSFNKSENEKSSFFSDLSEAHLKETFEFPLDLKPKTIKGFIPLKDDYKPKILTTDQYFTKKKPIEKPVILSNEKNFDGVLLDSLIHYPWKPFTKEKPDDRYQRDFFTEGFAKIIEKTLKEGKDFKSPKKMNEDFVKLLKINEFDRDEFKSGKRLLEAKRMANLNKESNLKNIAGGFIPTHSLNSDIKVQAEGVLAKESMEETLKSFKKSLIKAQIEKKVKKNEELHAYEKGFLQREGLLKKSLVDILVKHKSFFKLENQAKRIEKSYASKIKTQMKELEHLRKKNIASESQTLGENLLSSPLSTRNMKQTQKKKDSNRAFTKEICYSITERNNKLVMGEVIKDLEENKGVILAVKGELDPNERKKKERKLERALRKRKVTIGLKYKDISLSLRKND